MESASARRRLADHFGDRPKWGSILGIGHNLLIFRCIFLLMDDRSRNARLLSEPKERYCLFV
jgi:hypothetical protein